MSELKYCQGPKCHMYDTKDRKRGPKDNKRNETRRRSHFNYLGGNACSMTCQDDWFNTYGQRALQHFGMITQPRVLTADNAWAVRRNWSYREGQSDTFYAYNYLTEERRPITEQQYDNDQTITDDGRLAI